MTPLFNTYMQKVLNEMPWIEFSTTVPFDLELEIIGNLEELVSRLVKILSGDHVIDKYQNVLELKTPEDKDRFWNTLKTNNTFKTIIHKKFGKEIIDLENLLKTRINL